MLRKIVHGPQRGFCSTLVALSDSAINNCLHVPNSVLSCLQHKSINSGFAHVCPRSPFAEFITAVPNDASLVGFGQLKYLFMSQAPAAKNPLTFRQRVIRGLFRVLSLVVLLLASMWRSGGMGVLINRDISQSSMSVTMKVQKPLLTQHQRMHWN